MINKTKTIDKRPRIGAVNPTKVKIDRNVKTDTNLKCWTNPDYLIKLFDNYGKEIARLKKQRRNRLKKRGYIGIELKNQALHFWAVNNYANRKEIENEKIRQSDVLRISATRQRGLNTLTKIDFSFKYSEITTDTLNLQVIREYKILEEQSDKKEIVKQKKAQKLIEDFYNSECEKLIGLIPIGAKKTVITIGTLEIIFDNDDFKQHPAL
jgi:hypothetical protein